jgi:hypothetical protein
MTNENTTMPDEVIFRKILVIRNQKVMLDSDLAELYLVDTKRLNEQVKRNAARFPADFMFQLNEEEWNHLKSQIATSSLWGGRRKLPYAFTEHGVLMLSSVLSSNRAIEMNIRIMRVYVKIREIMQTNTDVLARMNEMEDRMSGQDDKILRLFSLMQEQLQPEGNRDRRKVGYKGNEEGA